MQPALHPTAEIESSFWVHAKAPPLMRASLHGLSAAMWAQDGATVTDINTVNDQITVSHIGVLHYLFVRNAPVWTQDKVKKTKS